MIRGETLIVHTIPILVRKGDAKAITSGYRVVAGEQWCTGPIQHIAILGPADLGMDHIKNCFDTLTYDQWLCAHTLASDGWHGTPEELINAAKELS